MSEAVYIAEFRNISQGIGVLDKMLKQSGVFLMHATPICIGKYLICVGGDVADAREAQKAAEEPEEQDSRISGYLLTGAHPAILAYFKNPNESMGSGFVSDAMGVFETRNAAAGFISLDAALKNSQVELRRLWLGNFLGGKFCYVLSGSTDDVRSALKAAAFAVSEKEQVGQRLILSPDDTIVNLFTKGGA